MNSLIPPSAGRIAFPVRVTCHLGLWSAFAVALVFLELSPQAHGADFTVGAGINFYSFSGVSGQNPTLTLVRGETYTFAVNTGVSHPLRINSTGVQNNGTFSGTITWTVPLAASNYTYVCTVHGFGGTIVTVPVRLASFRVNSNLVIRTTAPSNYSVFPEFKTNATSANWLALSIQTNRFLLGTNETICGLPPGSNVFIRVKAKRN